MKLLNKLRRKGKIKNLTAEGRIEAASNKVNEAFIMFQQAQDAIDESNSELLQAAVAAEREAESYLAKAESAATTQRKALDNIEANKKLSEQLKPFII